jgi:5'-3' exonuclease
MRVHLVDGTYELFRAYYGAPSRKAPDGREVGAVVGLLNSLAALLAGPGVTHVGCAFDHVIESFRNDLYPGYKTGEGIPDDLLAQFPLAEQAAAHLGLAVWPMVEFEADDAVASAVAQCAEQPRVEQIVICSPDKDFAQLVSGSRIVCWDRRRDIVYDEERVMAKFGVPPASIPDWLALVGDAADGFPGLPGWGAKAAATVLARFGHLEDIPASPAGWGLGTRGTRLSTALREQWDDVLLYRRLATLRTHVPIQASPDDLAWKGVNAALTGFCQALGAERVGTGLLRAAGATALRS